jgi:hypothetical protein
MISLLRSKYSKGVFMRYSNSPGFPGSETWWRVYHHKDELCQGHFVGNVHRREYESIPTPADIAGKSYRYEAFTDMQLPVKNGNENYFPSLETAIKAIEDTHKQALEQALVLIAES